MIGFFDSGVGGLTILEEVHRRLPQYDTLYLGDTERAPYGNKTHEQLVAYTWQGCEWLFAQGCQLVIVACNSASASALREIQQTKLIAYPEKRILGVIRPTVEALSQRGHKHIVVLSTVATKESGAYAKEFEKQNPEIHVFSHACPNWAPLIEAGKATAKEMEDDMEKEIAALEQEVPEYDAVLLACTHYSYIRGRVEELLSKKVPVYNQGGLVADALMTYLERHPEIEATLKKNAARTYDVTGNALLASLIASERFGFNVTFEQVEIKKPVIPTETVLRA